MINGHFGMKNRGFTLVEMLIAMALSLLLMGGAIGIFVSSKQAYRTEDAMSRNQENGRFAVSLLSKNIREAGYVGCSNLEDIQPIVIAKPAPAEGYAIGSAIIGFEGGGSSASNASSTWTDPTDGKIWVPNTDVLILSNGGDCGTDLTGNMKSENANIQISSTYTCDFKAGDALLITDCQSADLFRATNVSEGDASTKLTIAHANSSNTKNRLSRAYADNATVLKFLQYSYFIGQADNSNPALYRMNVDNTVEALVDNVADMQIIYGVDNGEDGVVDEYQSASGVSDWKDVLSVQLSLLVRSDDNALTEKQVVTFNGSDINSGTKADNRLRSIFNANVSIRNRLP